MTKVYVTQAFSTHMSDFIMGITVSCVYSAGVYPLPANAK